jgi:hypothetical protein
VHLECCGGQGGRGKPSYEIQIGECLFVWLSAMRTPMDSTLIESACEKVLVDGSLL